jgi:hypothetical protein
MFKFYFRIWLILIITALLCHTSLKAQEESFKLYYVAVGSDHYASFDTVPGMGLSARVVSEYLERFGAVEGVTLRSKNKRYISKQMILEQIDRLQHKMNNDDGKEVVMIFYYAGHCLGEPLTGQQWLFPGNIQIDINYLKELIIDSDKFNKALLSPNELHNSLNNSLVTQTMIIMDCCYSAGDNSYQRVSSYLTSILGTRQISFIDDLRNMNLSRDPWRTSIYATTPGKSAYSVKAPDFMAMRIAYPIGPLARRLSLIFKELEASNSTMSYQAFVNAMKRPNLDTVTEAAKNYNNDIYIDRQLFTNRRVLADIKLNQIYASKVPTSTLMHTDEDVFFKTNSGMVSSIAVGDSAISIFSDKGDWIGQGKTILLSAKNHKIRMIQDLNRLVINSKGVDEIDKWTFEVLLPKKYEINNDNADTVNGEQYYWAGKNEIEISVLGRGCSSRLGDYVIKEYQRNEQDAVVRLKMDFTHYCDDNSNGLIGNMDLILKPIF